MVGSLLAEGVRKAGRRGDGKLCADWDMRSSISWLNGGAGVSCQLAGKEAGRGSEEVERFSLRNSCMSSPCPFVLWGLLLCSLRC